MKTKVKAGPGEKKENTCENTLKYVLRSVQQSCYNLRTTLALSFQEDKARKEKNDLIFFRRKKKGAPGRRAFPS